MAVEYKKTQWLDHIVDITLSPNDPNYVIEKGTTHTARRMNNMEDGIYDAHTVLSAHETEMQKLRVQLEMVGRAPVNNGTFYDTLDGQNAKQLTRLVASAVGQVALAVGATSITLDTVPFVANEYVTIYDNIQSETIKVTAISTAAITTTALTKAYKKGAFVRKSSAKVDAALQEMQFGNWGNYSVAISEVV